MKNTITEQVSTIVVISGAAITAGSILSFCAAIGKTAAINIFHIAGDLILGAGIASFSLGVDGLSQSISSTSSATNAGYGARILGYQDDIKKMMPILQAKYGGFTVTTL